MRNPASRIRAIGDRGFETARPRDRNRNTVRKLKLRAPDGLYRLPETPSPVELLVQQSGRWDHGKLRNQDAVHLPDLT